MHFSAIALPLAMAAAAVATTCKTPVGWVSRSLNISMLIILQVGSGTCGYTSSACSGGGYIAGFCPGPANFQVRSLYATSETANAYSNPSAVSRALEVPSLVWMKPNLQIVVR